jgi:TPR repeat protein
MAPPPRNFVDGERRPSVLKRRLPRTLFAVLLLGTLMRPACADGLARGTAAYYRGDYARAVRELIPAAAQGNAQAQAQLGFMYENGFGVPQNYVVAADLYQSAAAHGDVFGQSRLGLSYDRGHGVPQSVVFSYAWLNLAAAGASGRQADYYRRLRDAVASKMTAAQIFEGQRLALIWAAPPPAP